MNSSVVEIRPKAREVAITDDELVVLLADGRKISVPLVWFPRLLHASADQRQHFELLGDGEGIHWPDIDEGLSVAGLLRGALTPGRAGSASWRVQLSRCRGRQAKLRIRQDFRSRSGVCGFAGSLCYPRHTASA